MREFDLLQHVFSANATLADIVTIPPGDDMGMVRLRGDQVLAAVDQVVDGRHFRLATTPIELIGRKAITRSLSDIAAMAARPLATLVAATLPPDFGSSRANALFDAMRTTAATWDSPIIGGDLAFHASPDHPLTCSVTVLAVPGKAGRSPARRDVAKAGDGVYVTGRLGGSLDPGGLGRHLTFDPRIHEALAIADTLGDALHAMIDISDGLGRDASHIAAMSGVRIILDAAAIPCHKGCDWKRAISDGEDYELCFTANQTPPRSIGAVTITRIGEVTALPAGDTRQMLVRDGSSLIGADQCGWQHQAP